ncbi:MAG: arylsulfotransferase family protein [Solirubrobacteraceae bacterium]|nr:arylsulfotransferase family protein [Solirubrobacteraceae bacterium]
MSTDAENPSGPARERGPGRRTIITVLVAVVALLAAAAIVVAAGGDDDGDRSTSVKLAAPPEPQGFASRPDLRPPPVKVLKSTDEQAPGYVFVAPKKIPNGGGDDGLMIYDRNGDLVWFDANGKLPGGKDRSRMNFNVQTYRGKPVLTWWEGEAKRGFGEGEGVIADMHYRVIARVQPKGPLKADFHEFHLTDRGTALMLAYHERKKRHDLRKAGGVKRDRLMENTVLEIDVKTGKTLFRWDASDHVDPLDSIHPVPKRDDLPYDFFHGNSVDIDENGDYIVSARSLHAVYAIDRKTKKINWQLNGRRSDFKMGKGSVFRWQHDARPVGKDLVSVLDNHAFSAKEKATKGAESRGIILRLDRKRKRATLVKEYRRPGGTLGPTQANMQTLPDGNRMVGWGGETPRLTEFTDDGRVAFDARFERTPTETYRAYKQPWVGRPTDDPAIASRRGTNGTAVRASWNGATEVATWRVVGGDTAKDLKPLGEAPRKGFDSLVMVPGRPAWVAAEALDAQGEVLGRSKAVRPGDTTYVTSRRGSAKDR